ncbi:hypothetical protein VFPPC_14880 [Pochonia chlamydosporia 170]|uniref:IDI-3 protein n=1 Tax=Pochonia chlamydosporia 170 TaxID=1380566 RepID=A0A179FB75_METCM|nr:hypothetical protein VFPPC_14880 [Pochonia chlamydosporia 170]OAQ62706.1 hypothetical protein VFPPC_14880 [Pochonia chlamydosporia 170]
MLTKTILAITSLATAAFAAPLEARSSPPSGYGTITPSALYVYDVSTGAIGPQTTTAKVEKNRNIHEKTTLMTFTYPTESTNKKCALYFYYDSVSWSGTDKLAIYSSLNPAPGQTSGWGPGNQRNNQLGIWKKPSSSPSWADWEATYGGLSGAQDCKPGVTEAFEIVGQGDETWISYENAVGGVRILYW